MKLVKIAVSSFGIWAVMCMFVFNSSVMAADVAKIGVIDLEKIFKTSDAGKKAQDEITIAGNRMKKDLEAKETEIKEMRKQLEKDALVMRPEKREEREREIRIKINDIKSLQKRYMDDFKRIEGRHIKKIRDDIMEIVKEVGKKEGYLLIIEKTVVLYSPNTVEITERLIESYNKKLKG